MPLHSISFVPFLPELQVPSNGGTLEMVFLNACCSESIGRALVAQGAVPYVVCWQTLCEDKAARLFARAFFHACALGLDYVAAFDKAQLAVSSITIRGRDGNQTAQPMYELRDPLTQTNDPNAARAAGVPMLLSSGMDMVGT